MAVLNETLNKEFRAAMTDWRVAFEKLKLAFDKKDFKKAGPLIEQSSSALERACHLQLALINEIAERFK